MIAPPAAVEFIHQTFSSSSAAAGDDNGATAAAAVSPAPNALALVAFAPHPPPPPQQPPPPPQPPQGCPVLRFSPAPSPSPHGASLPSFLAAVKLRFASAADAFSLLSPPQKEGLFLSMLRSGTPLRFQYLQALAVAALDAKPGAGGAAALTGATPVNGGLAAAPAGGAHAWCPTALGVLPGSVLPRLLAACEAAAAADAAATSSGGDDDGEDEAVQDAAAAEMNEPRGRIAAAAAPPQRARAGGRARKPIAAAAAAAAAASASADGAMADAEAAAAALASPAFGSGIITPWLYYSSCFSAFAAHSEDYALGSANVLLSPPDAACHVVWYSVPRKSIVMLHEFLRDFMGPAYSLHCLETRRLWINPTNVAAWNEARAASGLDTLPVYRHVQGPG